MWSVCKQCDCGLYLKHVDKMLEALRKYLNKSRTKKEELKERTWPVKILEAYEDAQKLPGFKRSAVLRAMPKHTTSDEFTRFIEHLEFTTASARPLAGRA
jgi:hypothetical protein